VIICSAQAIPFSPHKLQFALPLETMTSSCCYRSRDYRGAIALNNMGVSLMEQKAYHQAMETLKDAVSVMRAACQSHTMERHDCASVDDKLGQASQRLTNLRPEKDTTAVIKGISHDEGFVSIRTVLGKHDPMLADAMFPMRIEHLEDSEDSENNLKAAIIVHNFALAHLCLARKMTNDSLRARLHESALRLASVVFTILRGTMGNDFLRGLILRDTNAFVAIISTLRTLMQVQSTVGNFLEAEQCSERLDYMASLALEFDPPELRKAGATAAAAA
jgi:hypothetical protein